MSKFTALDHIDIVVQDPDTMADYFISLGFTEIRRTDHNGGAVELRFPGEGDQPILELTAQHGEGRPSFNLGLRHMALRCDNVDQTYRELTEEGKTFDKEPRAIPSTGRRLTNLIDPEGNVLQVVS